MTQDKFFGVDIAKEEDRTFVNGKEVHRTMPPDEFFKKHPSLKEVEGETLKYGVMDYGSGYFKCAPHLLPDAILLEGVARTQTDNAIIEERKRYCKIKAITAQQIASETNDEGAKREHERWLIRYDELDALSSGKDVPRVVRVDDLKRAISKQQSVSREKNGERLGFVNYLNGKKLLEELGLGEDE